MKKLNLNAIRIDGGTQSRVEINNEIVADYADGIASGIEFPPVVVFHDGADHWLADGFHRFHAHRHAGKASIAADVRAGTVRDAVLFSLGANSAHGLHRSNADKRKAVQTMLADAEWAEWSDRKIAEACGVSVPFVGAIRRPQVAAKQQEHRAAHAEKTAGCNPITPLQVSRESSKPATQPPAAPPEEESFGPSAEELAAQQREEEEERAAMQRLIDSDDKLATLAAENKQLRAMNRVLEERVNGLMEEKNAAIRQAKKWQRKAEQLERTAA